MLLIHLFSCIFSYHIEWLKTNHLPRIKPLSPFANWLHWNLKYSKLCKWLGVYTSVNQNLITVKWESNYFGPWSLITTWTLCLRYDFNKVSNYSNFIIFLFSIVIRYSEGKSLLYITELSKFYNILSGFCTTIPD